MQTKRVSPATRCAGKVSVPSDKSLTHRSILLSALSDGTSTITNPLLAQDCLSTASCVEALGIKIDRSSDRWSVQGRGLWGFDAPRSPLDCGNSGTTMRLLSGILAAQPFESELFGDASLSRRPMDRISKPLETMGARFHLREGKFAPFKIKGNKNLTPIEWSNPVASAQVKSAVLLAGLHARGTTTFSEPSLSRDHTERMLSACGVDLQRSSKGISLTGPARLRAQDWFVPGDFSSAAFFLVAALLIDGADVNLTNVNLNPTRTGLLSILRQMGAKIDVTERNEGGEPIGDLRVRGKQSLRSIRLDPTVVPHLIDEIPILAVAATQANGISELRGIEDLRVKETDRIKAMGENLRAMGARVREEADALIIEGPTPLNGAALKSFEDHRIAMSGAIAAMIADGETTIEGSDCVAISFPTFWTLLDQLQK